MDPTAAMPELNSNIEKMLAELSKQILSGNQLSHLFDNPKEFPTHLVEKLALETALRYWIGQFNYEEGDCIINNIYSFWITNDYSHNYAFSGIAWECYDAFDCGEYYHFDDDRSIEPAEKYTRPFIEALLRKRNLIE